MSGPPSAAAARYVEIRCRRDDAHDVGAWLGAMDAPVDVIAAQQRVVAAFDSVSTSAAEAACTCGGINAAPHAIDHTQDCAIWDPAPALEIVRKVVERYGRVWAKDTYYYRAAEVLDEALRALDGDEASE